MMATYRGHTEAMQELLGRGAAVEDRKENGNTALIAAATQGHLGAVRMLLDHQAEVNDKMKNDAAAIIQAGFSDAFGVN